MKTFPKRVLAAIDRGLFIKIRAGATEHRLIGIWAVVVEDRVFVRSWDVKAGGWYRTLVKEPHGMIDVAGQKITIGARPAKGARLSSAIDRAYLEKYHTKGWRKYAEGLARPKRRATTTELTPA